MIPCLFSRMNRCHGAFALIAIYMFTMAHTHPTTTGKFKLLIAQPQCRQGPCPLVTQSISQRQTLGTSISTSSLLKTESAKQFARAARSPTMAP
jgi:hypothetical protein